MLLFGKDEEKKQGAFVVALGAALCIIGVESGRSVKSVRVSATSMEVSFSDEPVALSRQQITGAQQAQQARLTPKPLLASAGTQRVQPSDFFAAATRRYQEQTATLHAALQQAGFTPMADPTMDISPGAVVSVAADGKVTVHFSRQDAFPGLKIRSSPFDFVQFTSMQGTKSGFGDVGSFTCEQGFQEDRDETSHTLVSTNFSAYFAVKNDPCIDGGGQRARMHGMGYARQAV